MSLSESDRILVDAIKRRLRQWRIWRWAGLLGNCIMSLNGWYLLLHMAQDTAPSSTVPSTAHMLLMVTACLCSIAGPLGLAHIMFNWNGSRVERLLVSITETLDQADRESPRQ